MFAILFPDPIFGLPARQGRSRRAFEPHRSWRRPPAAGSRCSPERKYPSRIWNARPSPAAKMTALVRIAKGPVQTRCSKKALAMNSQRRRPRTVHGERVGVEHRPWKPSTVWVRFSGTRFRHAQPNQYRRHLQSGDPSENRRTPASVFAGKPATTCAAQKAG